MNCILLSVSRYLYSVTAPVCLLSVHFVKAESAH